VSRNRHASRVNSCRLGRAHRAIRTRLELRQQDVTHRSGVRREKVSRIERGRWDTLTLADIERSFEALGARLHIRVEWQGAELDRLLDEGHARLAGRTVELLKLCEWQVVAEVTFSHFGERGSIDLLAWHPQTRILLVVEIKTELGAVEGLLRPLDVKVRQAPRVARERLGWRPVAVSRLVVLPDDRTARRRVERHEAVLRAALPLRSREVHCWLREPNGTVGGILFLTDERGGHTKPNPSAVRRVRRPASHSNAAR
jgi:transcriptional regulator with XRE-family HTH domain